jgi:hypothetical protein
LLIRKRFLQLIVSIHRVELPLNLRMLSACFP